MDENFSRQARRFFAAILTDCKGNRRSMAGKRPDRRRATVVNTGSRPTGAGSAIVDKEDFSFEADKTVATKILDEEVI